MSSAAETARSADVADDGDDGEGNVFGDLRLSSHEALHRCARKRCPGACGKQRRYYCCECLIPMMEPASALPSVTLPLHIHVLQSGGERPQRSTAQHIALLAPKHATIWRPFPECGTRFRTSIIERSKPGSVAVL